MTSRCIKMSKQRCILVILVYHECKFGGVWHRNKEGRKRRQGDKTGFEFFTLKWWRCHFRKRWLRSHVVSNGWWGGGICPDGVCNLLLDLCYPHEEKKGIKMELGRRFLDVFTMKWCSLVLSLTESQHPYHRPPPNTTLTAHTDTHPQSQTYPPCVSSFFPPLAKANLQRRECG